MIDRIHVYLKNKTIEVRINVLLQKKIIQNVYSVSETKNKLIRNVSESIFFLKINLNN